ncbi:DUF1097 domain-containing protein [Patescibacteria group bacterium]|nr:DUF1097 domain-containing protein [Patescibacteria group bacterium]MBU2219524.1 DUF1097 domain-containing protein [Patescibacteria group bacterium]
MTFKKFIPVSLMVAAFAALYIWVAPYLKISSLWVPFISWPLYFIAGAKPSRLHKEIFALAGGAIFGFLTIFVSGALTPMLGSYALAATVFIVAFLIVMLELTDWFELAPAYFFAFAGYFAYVFGGFAGTMASSTDYAMAMVPFFLLLMLGLGLGYITALLRKKILEKEGVYGQDQKTVFDKENNQ